MKLVYLYSTIKMMHGPINIIKQVTSVGLSLFNYQDDARSNKHNDSLLFAVELWDFYFCFLLYFQLALQFSR